MTALTMTTDKLEVRDLRISFGRREVVHGVSLEVARGQAIGLVGESGSGKSVTGKAIMGLLRPPAQVSYGALQFAGVGLPPVGQRRKVWGKGQQPVAMISQNPFTALNPVFRISQTLGDVLTKRRGLSKQAAAARSLELLESVRIPAAAGVLRSYPHELSGGMLQRVGIALALALDSSVLIADEPTTALDVTVQAEILTLLDQLRLERQLGIIFISHDLAVVNDIASQVYVMYAGRIVEHGPVEQILEHPTHPYTHGLVESIPSVDVRQEIMASIPGTINSARGLDDCCALNPRCPFVDSVCRTDVPQLRTSRDGLRTACHHWERAVSVWGDR